MRGKNKKNEKVNKVEKAVKKVTDPIEKVGNYKYREKSRKSCKRYS